MLAGWPLAERSGRQADARIDTGGKQTQAAREKLSGQGWRPRTTGRQPADCARSKPASQCLARELSCEQTGTSPRPRGIETAVQGQRVERLVQRMGYWPGENLSQTGENGVHQAIQLVLGLTEKEEERPLAERKRPVSSTFKHSSDG